MSKELKAFIGICCNTNQNYPDFQKQKKIVETALKEKEQLEEELVEWKARFSNDYIGTMVEARVGAEYKKLKALEIIKEKEVNVRCLIDCFLTNVNFYNQVITDKSRQLTKEEFDLLKEVL